MAAPALGTLLGIGASKESIEVATAGITKILEMGRGDSTTKEALRAFGRVCEVSNVTIHDCQFYGGDAPISPPPNMTK